jgi:hypothetical protein
VFAGAARAAVFSNPKVIARIQAGFVPVALKAALVNQPPPNAEGRLCREIGRSKPAPQGICVANSAGKVLSWALMFDDDQRVLAFLDHAAKRFARYQGARRPVPAERYMRYPSEKLEDVADTRQKLPVAERHPKGESCPARPGLREGTVAVRLIGRALDKKGMPLADTVRQEHYVEDRFHVSVGLQEALAKAARAAGTKRFPFPDPLARLLVSHAYLGQLDVNPVDAPASKGRLDRCELWGRQVPTEGFGPVRIRIEGQSRAVGHSSGREGDGRLWKHEVRLDWEGWVEMHRGRMTHLVVMANGTEKLRWGDRAWAEQSAEVAHLPGGHFIDLACRVRYGIVGRPIPAEEGGRAEPDGGDQLVGPVPEEVRRQLVEALGPPFLVFRQRVREDLKLSDDQKQTLETMVAETVRDAMQFFAKVQDLEPSERDRRHHAFRHQAQEKLAAFLKERLRPDQRRRLRQLEIQHEGPFALMGDPKLSAEMNVTNDQRQRIMAVVQGMEKKIQALLHGAGPNPDPRRVGPKAMQIRQDHARRIESVLTDAQRKQWRQLVGKPVKLDD